MKNLTFLAAFLLFTLTLSGQTETLDSIFTRDGAIITAKIKEIGTAEVKYVQPQINPDVVYVIDKNKIERIVFYNGQVQQFEAISQPLETIERNSDYLFQTQKKKALKIDFFGIATNTLTLTYEQCLRPGRSIEFSGGYIGVGTGLQEENASGILLRGGYKIARNPDYYLSGMRYSHILKGAYLKLEFDFASYSVEGYKDFFEEKEKYNNTKWAFLIVFGNQWVLDDKFLIDVYSGIGLGNNSLKDLDLTYPYGFATLGDNFPMAMSFGVRLGILLK